jgi:tight adherence protein C
MPTWTVLLSFFVLTMGSIVAVSYWLVLRHAGVGTETDRVAIESPHGTASDLFGVLGRAFPASTRQYAIARQRLLRAGYRWPGAVETFLGIKIALASALGVGGAWASFTFSGGNAASIASAAGLCAGFLLPDFALRRAARQRSRRIRQGLPTAIDLLVLTMEAGQSIDSSILETSRGLQTSFPDLALELRQLHVETRAETSRAVALRNLAMRTQDSEIQKFTALLIDADRFGSSLGPALRTHGRYLRNRVRQRAQERARKIGAKLIFPVFFLIFPSVILVTLGPAVILIQQQLGVMLGK